MGRFTRRDFLRAGGAAFAASMVGWPSTAHADWGDFPAPLPSSPWPSTPPNYKVLEIFLYGGVSPWETFYHRPGLADPWYGQLPQINALSWACTGSPSPNSQTQSFSNDGGSIHLGPLTKPIWSSYITQRMRLVTLKHGLEPHEAAIPYSITGHVLGRPNFSSLGAAISHRYKSLGSTTPVSYVFMPNNLGVAGDNFQAVDATGMHGGEHRPLKLLVGPGSDSFISRLQRPGMNGSNRDELFNYYRAWYRDRLRWRGGSADADLIRSKGFGAYDSSANTLVNATDLHTLLGTVPLALQDTLECPIGGATMKSDRTGSSILAAAKLLTTAEAAGGARHVCVVDGGVNHYGGAAYDTHGTNIPGTAINLWTTLDALASVIEDPASPDPDKISLDDTLIVLKTEFGRDPINSGGGRNHWPQGYVNMLIGGPVEAPTGSVKNVVGIINNSGFADDNNHYTPSDLQAALHIAAGIFPFESENFGVGDMGPKIKRASEQETAVELWKQILLGQTS